MIPKFNFSNFIPKILFIVAIIGFIILWLTVKMETRSIMGHFDLSKLYTLAVGIALIIPYLFYLFTTKEEPKRVLTSNAKDFNKISLTEIEYINDKSLSNIFEIYVKNETPEKLIINRESLLEPNVWHIFTIEKNESIYFSNGIKLHIDKDLNLVIVDNRNQLIEIRYDYFQKNNVPMYVNRAFVIGEPNLDFVVE